MNKDTLFDIIEETVDEIYLSLKYSFKDITVFPGELLKVPFFISLGITFVSLICWLFNIVRFTNWIGAFVGTIILGILYYVGKEDKDGESESIRDSEDSFGDTSGREESTGQTGHATGREDFAELLSNSVPVDAENDSHS